MPLKSGDRFSIHRGRRELFTLKIKWDDSGDILLDRNGIFIRRTRRIDILLGGIFDELCLDDAGEEPEALVLRPLQGLGEPVR